MPGEEGQTGSPGHQGPLVRQEIHLCEDYFLKNIVKTIMIEI